MGRLKKQTYKDRWVISRHVAPTRGKYLRWHGEQVYAWTNSRHKAARFPTYGAAVKALESITYGGRTDIGRI